MQRSKGECEGCRDREYIPGDLVCAAEGKVCEFSQYYFRSCHDCRKDQQAAADPYDNPGDFLRLFEKSVQHSPKGVAPIADGRRP